MNKLRTFLFVFFVVLIISLNAPAQALNKIQGQCVLPTRGFATVSVKISGDIWHVPCSTKSSIFFGNVDFTSATVTGVVTGSGTANFIPRWLSASALTNTPFSWDATTYLWRNTALNDTFGMTLTPSATVGQFTVGEAAGSSVVLNQATGVTLINGGTGSQINVNSRNGNTQIGDTLVAGNGTRLSINDTSQTYVFNNTANAAIFNVQGINSFLVRRTITAAATTGDQTINRPFGTVNFAAAASDIVVTNSLAAATSLIFCTVQSLDATAISCRITDKAPGSFHIRVPAATAETSVAFWVTN